MAWEFTPGEQLDYPAGAHIKIIDDFLSADTLAEAQKDAQLLYKHGEYFRTNQTWGQHLVKNSGTVLITNVMNEAVNKGLQQAVEDKLPDYQYTEEQLYNRAAGNTPLYQMWPAGSYIPWHNDGGHTASVTIYLNDQHRDDGGFFMYDDGKGVKAVMPKANRAVFATGGIYHTVTQINPGAPVRHSLRKLLEPKSNVNK